MKRGARWGTRRYVAARGACSAVRDTGRGTMCGVLRGTGLELDGTQQAGTQLVGTQQAGTHLAGTHLAGTKRMRDADPRDADTDADVTDTAEGSENSEGSEDCEGSSAGDSDDSDSTYVEGSSAATDARRARKRKGRFSGLRATPYTHRDDGTVAPWPRQHRISFFDRDGVAWHDVPYLLYVLWFVITEAPALPLPCPWRGLITVANAPCHGHAAPAVYLVVDVAALCAALDEHGATTDVRWRSLQRLLSLYGFRAYHGVAVDRATQFPMQHVFLHSRAALAARLLHVRVRQGHAWMSDAPPPAPATAPATATAPTAARVAPTRAATLAAKAAAATAAAPSVPPPLPRCAPFNVWRPAADARAAAAAAAAAAVAVTYAAATSAAGVAAAPWNVETELAAFDVTTHAVVAPAPAPAPATTSVTVPTTAACTVPHAAPHAAPHIASPTNAVYGDVADTDYDASDEATADAFATAADGDGDADVAPDAVVAAAADADARANLEAWLLECAPAGSSAARDYGMHVHACSPPDAPAIASAATAVFEPAAAVCMQHAYDTDDDCLCLRRAPLAPVLAAHAPAYAYAYA